MTPSDPRSLTRQLIVSSQDSGKAPDGELTHDEAIQCLEEELCRPRSEKRLVDSDDGLGMGLGIDTSAPSTPFIPSGSGPITPNVEAQLGRLNLDTMDFSGPHTHPTAVQAASAQIPQANKRTRVFKLNLIQQPLQGRGTAYRRFGVDARADGLPLGSESSVSESASASEVEGEGESPTSSDATVERVINIKKLSSLSQTAYEFASGNDIITHVAVCASQDWARVDRMLVGNFVTANQAQRKVVTKVITKLSAGNYRIGCRRFPLLRYFSFRYHSIDDAQNSANNHCAKSTSPVNWKKKRCRCTSALVSGFFIR